METLKTLTTGTLKNMLIQIELRDEGVLASIRAELINRGEMQATGNVPDKKYCKDCGKELKQNEIPLPVCQICFDNYIDYD